MYLRGKVMYIMYDVENLFFSHDLQFMLFQKYDYINKLFTLIKLKIFLEKEMKLIKFYLEELRM